MGWQQVLNWANQLWATKNSHWGAKFNIAGYVFF